MSRQTSIKKPKSMSQEKYKIIQLACAIADTLKERKENISTGEYLSGLTAQNVIDEEIHQIENSLIPMIMNAEF